MDTKGLLFNMATLGELVPVLNSTARRLRHMQAAGLVKQGERGGYVLTGKGWEVASVVVAA